MPIKKISEKKNSNFCDKLSEKCGFLNTWSLLPLSHIQEATPFHTGMHACTQHLQESAVGMLDRSFFFFLTNILISLYGKVCVCVCVCNVNTCKDKSSLIVFKVSLEAHMLNMCRCHLTCLRKIKGALDFFFRISVKTTTEKKGHNKKITEYIKTSSHLTCTDLREVITV